MIAVVAAWVVVVLHVLFAAMESVGWKAMGRRMGLSKADVETTRMLALNQGAYNLGFAALLGAALVTGNAPAVMALLVFIIAMSVVGAASVRWTIFLIQGVPAIVALAATVLTV